MLQKNITTRVYEFRTDYVRSVQRSVLVSAYTSLIAAAASCFTSTGVFSGILAAAGVHYSSTALLDAIRFSSEQSVSYWGEKSGWAFDYVTPNAASRYYGYVRTYQNGNYGKITMVWDGMSSARYNYRWAFSVHPQAYNVPNSTILNGAYDTYTSAVVGYGRWPY